jgi:hypothetical protein
MASAGLSSSRGSFLKGASAVPLPPAARICPSPSNHCGMLRRLFAREWTLPRPQRTRTPRTPKLNPGSLQRRQRSLRASNPPPSSPCGDKRLAEFELRLAWNARVRFQFNENWQSAKNHQRVWNARSHPGPFRQHPRHHRPRSIFQRAPSRTFGIKILHQKLRQPNLPLKLLTPKLTTTALGIILPALATHALLRFSMATPIAEQHRRCPKAAGSPKPACATSPCRPAQTRQPPANQPSWANTAALNPAPGPTPPEDHRPAAAGWREAENSSQPPASLPAQVNVSMAEPPIFIARPLVRRRVPTATLLPTSRPFYAQLFGRVGHVLSLWSRMSVDYRASPLAAR